MIKVFTHENRMIVFNIKNLLHEAGIETVVMNEFAGGGVGDLAAFDTWPELWLEDETRLDDAQSILHAILEGDDNHDWYCRGCQEKNTAAFEVCWNCGRARDQ